MITVEPEPPVPAARLRDRAKKLHVDDLRPHPNNPRRSYGDLTRLIRSIKAEGVLVPLMVEDHGTSYWIIHGHRRWAATKLAKRKLLPCIVTDVHSPADAIIAMLSEDEKELLDEADKRAAILSLAREHEVPWEDIATRTGLNINEVMRLAGLAPHRLPEPSLGAGRRASPGAGVRPTPRPRGASPAHFGRHSADRPPTPAPPNTSPTWLYRLLDAHATGAFNDAALIAKLRERMGNWAPKAGV